MLRLDVSKKTSHGLIGIASFSRHNNRSNLFQLRLFENAFISNVCLISLPYVYRYSHHVNTRRWYLITKPLFISVLKHNLRTYLCVTVLIPEFSAATCDVHSEDCRTILAQYQPKLSTTNTNTCYCTRSVCSYFHLQRIMSLTYILMLCPNLW
jgi:hypothetical protein